MRDSNIQLITAQTVDELQSVAVLVRAYVQSLKIDLCFQDVDQELAQLPGEYSAPRGTLLMALVDAQPAGCCALRPLDTSDYPNSAEMKRLYVLPRFRGLGVGRMLTQAVLDFAQLCAYSSVLLDTLDEMETARAMYEDLGFVEIPPYYHNPLAGAHYLKVDLT